MNILQDILILIKASLLFSWLTINVYNLSVKCHQNFFECFECTDCPKLSKASHFVLYLDLFFFLVLIVSILSYSTSEPVFILNV